jgi:hypothetical protein
LADAMTDSPTDFNDLAASRRAWISDVLHPWCEQATRVELQNAAEEWVDIAGRPSVEKTLWTWAWGRFPVLVHDELPGLNETSPVRILLQDGTEVVGFPDAQRSEAGHLVLWSKDTELGPFSIDDVQAVTAADEG